MLSINFLKVKLFLYLKVIWIPQFEDPSKAQIRSHFVLITNPHKHKVKFGTYDSDNDVEEI